MKILIIVILTLMLSGDSFAETGIKRITGPGAGGASDLLSLKKINIPPPADDGKFKFTQTCRDPKSGTLKPGDTGYGDCMDIKKGEAHDVRQNDSIKKNSDEKN